MMDSEQRVGEHGVALFTGLVMPAKIYFTFVFISSTLSENIIPSATRLRRTQASAKHFDNIYRSGFEIFYNDFFKDQIETKYLGYTMENWDEISQSVRLDVQINTFNILKTSSLHIHIMLPDCNLSDDPLIFSRKIQNVSRISRQLYFAEPEGMAASPLLRAINENLNQSSKNANFAIPFSRYTYFSICNVDSDMFSNHQNYISKDIYSLLFMHAEGVDNNLSEQYISENNWHSAKFFRNYYQPGGMVSISTPYPDSVYQDNVEWFCPSQSSIGCVELNRSAKNVQFDQYDYSPEYPPNRYLGLMALEFAGMHEEATRSMYSQMMTEYTKRSFFYLIFRVFRSARNISEIESKLSVINNFEYIKLPVVRPLIKELIDDKSQDNLTRSIENLKSFLLNILLLALPIYFAILLEITDLAPSLTQIKDHLFLVLDWVSNLFSS